MDLLCIGLRVVAIPFVAPLISWYKISRLRGRVEELEREVLAQRDTIATLNARVSSLPHAPLAPPAAAQPAEPAAAGPRPAAPTPDVRIPATPPPPTTPVRAPSRPPAAAPGVGDRPAIPAAAVPAPVAAPTPQPPPPTPPRPRPGSSGFDWESLIGVKLFSAIAGVA